MNAARFLEAIDTSTLPDWMVGVHKTALDRFLTAGPTDAHAETWKYTSLAHLDHAVLHLPPAKIGEAVCPDVTAYPGHVLLFQNGQLSCHGTYLSNQIAGTLNHLGDTRPVHEHLGQVAEQNALTNLNLALWQDGARIYVPGGEQLAMPIFAVYAASAPDAMLHPRTLTILESDAEAVLVEHYLGQTGQTYWQNAVSEIVLGEGARLTHIMVMEEGQQSTHTGCTAVRMGRDSEYRALHVGLSGLLVRHDLSVMMDGPGGQVRIDAADLVDGRRHADLHLRVDHRAMRGTSRITYRGLASGRGQAVFDGRVVVNHGAYQTDARQDSKGLLLSRQAEIDVMPRLEIYADDVKCGHGASIGQLDHDALFYLRSRGIDEATAQQMLVEGFMTETLGLLDDVHLRDWLMPRLQAALARLDGKEHRHE
jgi:Fe-S cluster assembly protein SufD